MAMSQSERIRRIMEENNRIVARNKVRDSSELTLINQAKASSVAQPNIVSNTIDLHSSQLMPPYQYQSDCGANVVLQGKGTNNDYTSILQKAQSCAVCSDSDSVANAYITLPTPCYNRNGFPFVQSNISSAVYCKDPGFNAYGRREAICYSNTNIYILPSAN
jgi:hypothetical protein